MSKSAASRAATPAPFRARPRPEDLTPFDPCTFVACEVAPFYVVDPDRLDEIRSPLAYDLIELAAVAAFVAGVCLVAYALTGGA